MNRSRVTGDLASHGNIFVDIANDRVGIGSTIPTQKLDVTGNFAVSGQTNLTGDVTLGGTRPRLNFYDSDGNPDFAFINDSGMFQIFDQTNGGNRIQINSDGHVDILNHLDVNNGLDVTGNITATGNLTISNGQPTINLTDTDANSDYKVNVNTGNFYLADSTNNQTRFYLTSDGTGFFQNNFNVAGDLTLTDTATDSAAGPEFKLFRNSASPADADYLGQIKFAGESDTGVERNYAKITGKILDASNGTEDGIIEFAHIKAGSQVITGRWRSDSLQLLNGTNLSVAGDSTFTGDIDVDGHTELDNVTIAGIVTASNATISGNQILGHGNSTGNQIKFTRSGLGDELVIGTDGYGNSTQYEATIQSSIVTARPLVFATNNAERLRILGNGNITFGVQNAVTAVTSSTIKYISGGRDYWNGTKGDYRALRLRVYDNGGNIDDQYGIGISNGQLEIQSQGSIGFYASGAGSSTGRRVHAMTIDTGQKLLLGLTSARTNFFNAASTHVPRFQIESTNNDIGRAAIGLIYGKTNDSGPYITLAKHRSNTVGANTVVQSGDETGIISFQGSDGSEFLETAQIVSKVDGTPGSNDMPGRLVFKTTPDGAAATIERVRITSTGAVTISGNINQIAPTVYDDLTGTNQAGLIIGSSGITDAGIMLRTSTSGAGRIYFGDNSGSDANRKQGQIIYHNNGDYMSFAANGSERFRITSDGSSYFGPQIITEANLRWGHDANQRPYVFSGATGSNPADATIIAANPNTDPSGTRLGGFGFGCVTSSASGVGNSGLKAVIEGLTNNNVSDAWKTGARIRFLVRPDNGNLGEVFSCNSDGTIDQIANLTSNISLLRLRNARTRASGNKYGMEFRDSANEANANIVIQENSSGNNAAHMSFYMNAGTGGNGLENGNHTLRLKQGGDIEIPTGGIEFRSLGSSTPQAAPAFINMGGTHSNAHGNGTNLNAKLKLWSDGTDMMGLSISSNQFDFIVTQADYDYVWYGGNSGTTEHMRLEGGGNLTLTNGNKVRINAAAAAGTLALLNIGYDGGNNIETRAIDIKGGWSTGESKSITFTHATSSTQMVGQINSVHHGGSPGRTSPHSSLRFGKLYHTTDTSTYTMTLDSTSTTTADLNLKGAYRSTEHPAFSLDADGGQSDIGTTATKITYASSTTIGRNQASCYDTTNDRFVAPVDGMYHFYARHWFRPNATGTVTLLLYRNGSQIKESRFSSTSNGDYNTVQLSTTIFLSASNYVEIFGVSSSGSNFHVSSGSFHTEFSGFMVC